MRFVNIFLLFFLCCVYWTSAEALTKSMGQEVIRIDQPIKEMPLDIDEEPASQDDDNNDDNDADDDDDDKPATVTKTTTTTTTKVTERATTTEEVVNKSTTPETRRVNSPTTLDPLDEEDNKLAKELSEIYKDNDYKDESDMEKPPNGNKTALRAGGTFKFQPDLNDQRDIERFRTSVDQITCNKGVTRQSKSSKTNDKSAKPDGAAALIVNIGLLIIAAVIGVAK